jgi:hypothetical protein
MMNRLSYSAVLFLRVLMVKNGGEGERDEPAAEREDLTNAPF